MAPHIVRSGHDVAGHDKHRAARNHRAADTGRGLPLPARLLRRQSGFVERRTLLLDVGAASGLVVLRSSAATCLDAAIDEHHLRLAPDQRTRPHLVHPRWSGRDLLELEAPTRARHAGAVVLADRYDLTEFAAVLCHHTGRLQRPPADLPL